MATEQDVFRIGVLCDEIFEKSGILGLAFKHPAVIRANVGSDESGSWGMYTLDVSSLESVEKIDPLSKEQIQDLADLLYTGKPERTLGLIDFERRTIEVRVKKTEKVPMVIKLNPGVVQ